MRRFELATLLLLILQIIYGILTTIWFYKRKDLYPLKARTPWIHIFHQIGYWTCSLNMALWILTSYQGPCLWYHWSHLITCMVLGSPYVVRLFQLFFRYKLTQETMLRHQQKDLFAPSSKDVKSGWFTEHQRYLTSKYLLFFGLMMLPMATPLCGFFALAYPFLSFRVLTNDPSCPLIYSLSRNPYFAVVGISMMVFVVGGAMKVKGIEEGLWLRREFCFVALGSLIQCILMWIPEVNFRREVETISFIPASMWWITFSFTIPTLLTYSQQDTRRQSVPGSTIYESPTTSSVQRLEIYLQHERQYLAFYKFLANEFAVENLLFYTDVEKIRSYSLQLQQQQQQQQQDSPVESVELAQDPALNPTSAPTLYQLLEVLFSTYIAPDAPHMINISFEQRQEIIKNLNNLPSPDMISIEDIDIIFQTAVKEILCMLENDAFVRFTQSDFFISSSSDTPDDISLDDISPIRERGLVFSSFSLKEEKAHDMKLLGH